MPRWVKISLKILLIIIGLTVLLWLGLAWYVSRNKPALIKKITAQLNEQLNGELKIGSVDIVLLRSFPNISIALQDVSLRDSLWSQHHHELLKAKFVYAEVGVPSLIKGTADINRLVVEDGGVYLFTDSTGYTNTSVFRKKEKKKDKPNDTEIGKVRLEKMVFVIDNTPKSKLFIFDIKQLTGNWDYGIDKWTAYLNLDVLIKQFCFNSERGSFMKDETLRGKLKINYDENSKLLSIGEQPLSVGVTPIRINGDFNFTPVPATFKIEIRSDKMYYKEALKLMTPPIAAKLKMIDLKNTATVHAILIGKMKYRDTPWVRVMYNIKDNTLSTPAGDVTNVSFTGEYNNQMVRTNNHKDDNSTIRVIGMKGTVFGIDFIADSAIVKNLIRPVMEGRFRSKFKLKQLNPIIDGNTFNFDAGDADVDLLYKGGVNEDDTTNPFLVGHVKVNNTAFTYTPRSLAFTNCSATIQFMGSDLFFKNVRMQNGSSSLAMEGSILEFLNLYYKDPSKMVIDWHIKSPNLNLNTFRSFLSARQAVTVVKEPQVKRIGKLVTRLNTMLDASNAHLVVDVAKLEYKKFHAAAIKAEVTLKQNSIVMDHVNLQHAGGNIRLKGDVSTKSVSNPFKINAEIEHVNVQDLFYAFNNFGQDAIVDKNLNGQLSAETDVTGSIKSNGDIVPWSLNGDCFFHLSNGAIVNFEPFEKIGKFVFRKRNLSNVTFKKIENKLRIQGERIFISPMEIESSALNVFLEGVYGLKSGTDINMEIPLRNPKKDELVLDEELKEDRARKGIVLYLKAEDGEDGNVKIKWNKDGKRIETGNKIKSISP